MTRTLPTPRTLPRTVRLLAALLPFLLATSAARTSHRNRA
ncbi:hypothetical protein Daqu01_01525 [Deinococcus aquaticus]